MTFTPEKKRNIFTQLVLGYKTFKGISVEC